MVPPDHRRRKKLEMADLLSAACCNRRTTASSLSHSLLSSFFAPPPTVPSSLYSTTPDPESAMGAKAAPQRAHSISCLGSFPDRSGKDFSKWTGPLKAMQREPVTLVLIAEVVFAVRDASPPRPLHSGEIPRLGSDISSFVSPPARKKKRLGKELCF